MKIGKTKFVIGAAMALSVALTGCGSTINSDPAVNGPTTGVTGMDVNGNNWVGSAKCIDCHEGNTALGMKQVAAWKSSLHFENYFPTVWEDDGKPQECLTCHDAVGDSRILEDQLTAAAKVAARDTTPMDLAVVGCEACHGGGGQHYGKGPIPVGRPDFNSCGGASVATNGTSCHNALEDDPVAGLGGTADHSTYHAEGMNILPQYLESAHSRPEANHVAGRASTKCARCHTDEGGREYVNITAPDQLSSALWKPEWGTGSVIQCRTCHDAHNPGKLLKAASSSASAEYNTCTNCHQSATVKLTGDRWVDLPAGETTDGGMVTDTGTSQLIYHAGRYDRIIATTHYDDPETATVIEGMIVRTKVNNVVNDRACRDCHNVHSADLTIQKQWAASGHAGEIAEAKEAAVEANEEELDDTVEMTKLVQAAGSDGELFAWGHYNWDSTLKKGSTNYESDRGQCQECHTSTGFMNFANASASQAGVASYNYTANDFRHLSSWKAATGTIGTSINTANTAATVSSGQNELLYCWACHTDNEGGLRNPGAVALGNYPSSTSTVYTTFAQLNDVGSSNLCAKCHSGRNNLAGLIATAKTSRSSTRFANHHAITGGTLFAAQTHSAYEFTGKSYTPVEYFAHDKIGLDEVGEGEAQTGSGPCVSCHMGSTKNHTFNAVTKDGEGAITAINSQATCDTCHTGQYAITPAKLEEQKLGFYQMRELLVDLISNDVENFIDTPITDAVVRGQVAELSSLTDQNLLDIYGATQNSLMLSNDEPCAYVHNRYYAQRLLFDSINFMLNGSTTANTLDLSAYPLAAAWLQGETSTGNDNAVARP